MSDQLDLDAIRARADMATPGPWEVTVSGSIVIADHPQPRDWDSSYIVGSVGAYHTRKPSDSDAAFIAHAREDVPALLTHVADLQAKLVASSAPTSNETAPDVEALRADIAVAEPDDEYVVIVNTTIEDGPVARWYIHETAAENGYDLMSASRNGVLIHTYLHNIPEPLLAAASQAWQRLRSNRHADIGHLATHRRKYLMGREIEPMPPKGEA